MCVAGLGSGRCHHPGHPPYLPRTRLLQGLWRRRTGFTVQDLQGEPEIWHWGCGGASMQQQSRLSVTPRYFWSNRHWIIQFCMLSRSLYGIMEQKANLDTRSFMLCSNIFENFPAENQVLWDEKLILKCAKPCKNRAYSYEASHWVYFPLCGLARLSRNLLGISSWLYNLWLTVPAFTETSTWTLPTHDIPDIHTTQWTVIDPFFQFSKWKSTVAVM